MGATGSRWRDPWPWGLALWGAAVAALCFPPGPAWPGALLGPVPLWVAATGRTPRRGAWLGWAWGAGFFGALLWWLVPTLVRYGGLPWVAGVACAVLLCAYLALFPAAVGAFTALVSGRSAGWALALAPLAWTAAEGARGWLLTGLPWGDLPQAFWSWQGALAAAPWVGVDGVRLLMACAAAGPAWALALVLRRRPGGAPLVVCALGVSVWGVLALSRPPLPPDAGDLRVGVVQGNIDQAQKWDPAYRRSTLQTYEDLTLTLAARGPRLVVWPETAVPLYVQEPGPERARIQRLARRTGLWLLFGAPAYERTARGTEYRNAVFLMDPRGRIAGRYDKVHLVPFGEYVPFGRYLPFLGKLVEGAGDFRPGEGTRPVGGDGLPRLGVLICFEMIFPRLSAAQARQGAQVLVVVTNDGWFGRTPGPYQHLAFGAWRAAETGLPLVRAANTGISGVFDRQGRLLTATALMARDAFVADIAYPGPGLTPQAFVRPWVSPASLVLALVGLFAILRRPRPGAPAARDPR